MRIGIIAVAGLLLIAPVAASAAVVSNFDNDANGWWVADINPAAHQSTVGVANTPIWSATAGLSGGGLNIGDITYWTHIGAPATYLGDWRQGYGATISFDILITYTDGLPYSACAIRGMGHTLYYTTPTPPVGQWHHFSIPISLGGWKVDSYLGRDATAGDFWEVLRSVEGFFVMTEWDTGPDDTRVDNIVLGRDPVPPVGVNIRQKSLASGVGKLGAGHYRYRIWGTVTAVDPFGMTLDDESGNPVRVETPGPLYQIGDRVAVSGKATYNGSQTIITSAPTDISYL